MNYIRIDVICQNYKLERDFLYRIGEYGLIEITEVEEIGPSIPEEEIGRLEKVINLNNDLGVNLEGIEVIMHLLERIENLQSELMQMRSRIRIYE